MTSAHDTSTDVGAPPELGRRLLAETAALVDVASVSFHESAMAEHVEAQLRGIDGLEVARFGDNVLARTAGTRPRRAVLAGHLDTVPANGNETARIEGSTLRGLGSADMKGGLAVMLDTATRHASLAWETTYVFYAREEVAFEHSGLLELERLAPEWLTGDIAILGEPTDGRVEAGCQGVLRGTVTLRGARAHTARAWMGQNAIHKAHRVLALIDGYEARRVTLNGCQFIEALQATRIHGGVAGNVVCDEVEIDVAHRFAPDTDIDGAEKRVATLLAPALDPQDSWLVAERAPAAMPATDHPFVEVLISGSGAPPTAKLGWTDVAFFANRGVPAVNFGSGDPSVAHTADEYVTADSLERTARLLHDALSR